MQTYRSLSTIKAVQYTGSPIPEVTCSGDDAQYLANGCDNTRRHLTHVHTKAIGGMTVLKAGDWIFPEPGGPWGAVSDEKFRSYWEVPSEASAPAPVPDPPVPTEASAPAPVPDPPVPSEASAPAPVPDPPVPSEASAPAPVPDPPVPSEAEKKA